MKEGKIRKKDSSTVLQEVVKKPPAPPPASAKKKPSARRSDEVTEYPSLRIRSFSTMSVLYFRGVLRQLILGEYLCYQQGMVAEVTNHLKSLAAEDEDEVAALQSQLEKGGGAHGEVRNAVGAIPHLVVCVTL